MAQWLAALKQYNAQWYQITAQLRAEKQIAPPVFLTIKKPLSIQQQNQLCQCIVFSCMQLHHRQSADPAKVVWMMQHPETNDRANPVLDDTCAH